MYVDEGKLVIHGQLFYATKGFTHFMCFVLHCLVIIAVVFEALYMKPLMTENKFPCYTGFYINMHVFMS